MFFADGLNCSIFDREVFQEVIDGGLNCITVSLGFWEDALESMDALGRFRDVVQENEDLVAIAHNEEDINKIVASERCALIVGYPNPTA